MTFQKLLANTSISIINKQETFIFIEIEYSYYIFLNENHELKCFNLNIFKYTDQSYFLNQHFSLSNQELIQLEKSNEYFQLNFFPSTLTKVIGQVLKLYSLEFVDKNGFLTEQREMIEQMSNRYPLAIKRWKWTEHFKSFILVPNSEMAITFSLNRYKIYGIKSFPINMIEQSTKSEFYLSPYSFLIHNQHSIPNKNNDIFIGFEQNRLKKANTIHIRCTKQELIDSLSIIANTKNYLLKVSEQEIELHITNMKFAETINKYLDKINSILHHDYSLFEKQNDLHISKDNYVKILPGSFNNLIYPIINFSNNLSTIQIVIHFIINQLNPDLFVNIITYEPPSLINTVQNDDDEDLILEYMNQEDYLETNTTN